MDCARGQVLPFHPEELEQAELTATVTDVTAAGVRLALQGGTLARSPGRWRYPEGDYTARDAQWPRGLRTWIEGTAVVEPATGAVRELTLVARGWRWGRTRFNGRAGMLAPTPIGFLVTLAGSSPRERVAPTFFGLYGWK